MRSPQTERLVIVGDTKEKLPAPSPARDGLKTVTNPLSFLPRTSGFYGHPPCIRAGSLTAKLESRPRP